MDGLNSAMVQEAHILKKSRSEPIGYTCQRADGESQRLVWCHDRALSFWFEGEEKLQGKILCSDFVVGSRWGESPMRLAA